MLKILNVSLLHLGFVLVLFLLLLSSMYNLQDVLQSKAQRVFSPKEKSAVAVSATHRKSMGKLLFMSPTLVQINLRTQEPYRFKIESFWRAAQKLVCRASSKTDNWNDFAAAFRRLVCNPHSSSHRRQWSTIAILEQSPSYERIFHQREGKYMTIFSSASLWSMRAFSWCGLGTYRRWFRPLAFNFEVLHCAVIVLRRVAPASLWRDSIDIIAQCGWLVQSLCSEMPETYFGNHVGRGRRLCICSARPGDWIDPRLLLLFGLFQCPLY